MQSQLMLSFTNAANSCLVCHPTNASLWNHGGNPAHLKTAHFYTLLYKTGTSVAALLKLQLLTIGSRSANYYYCIDLMFWGEPFVSSRTILSATPLLTQAATGELGFHVLRSSSWRRSSAFPTAAVLTASRSRLSQATKTNKKLKHGSKTTILTREEDWRWPLSPAHAAHPFQGQILGTSFHRAEFLGSSFVCALPWICLLRGQY